MAIRFTRTDSNDGASEILTIVHVDGDPADLFRVEVCAGPEVGDDFVGLYDLDGDQIRLGNAEWEAAEDVPDDVIEAVELGWESGTNTVKRLSA